MKSEKNFEGMLKEEVIKNMPTETLKIEIVRRYKELLRRGMTKEEIVRRNEEYLRRRITKEELSSERLRQFSNQIFEMDSLIEEVV